MNVSEAQSKMLEVEAMYECPLCDYRSSEKNFVFDHLIYEH